MHTSIIQEGTICIKVPAVETVSKAMGVFYNPAMKFNRDIAVLVLAALKQQHLRIADPLAGTGIRGARLLTELPSTKIAHVAFNDANQNFKKTMRSLLKLNKLPNKKISVHTNDATTFLLNSTGFDYIDIDPFGTPNPYLDAAIKRLSREGVLAVTATDTSALAGSHPQACRRKYWAQPLKNELMHETGIRILTRKIQLVAAQYDKALLPIFSHATKHYYRIYFKCTKSKNAVSGIFRQHAFLLFCTTCRQHIVSDTNTSICNHCKKQHLAAGPLWTGPLWNTTLVRTMLRKNTNQLLNSFLKTILEESRTSLVGFYSLPKIASKAHCTLPPKEHLIMALKKAGFFVAPTHFAGDALRTNAPVTHLFRLLSNWRTIKNRDF